MRTGRPIHGRPKYGLLGPALTLIALAVAFFPVAAAPASAATSMPSRAALNQTPGRVIVGYGPGLSAAGARSAAKDKGAQVVGRVRTFGLKATGRCVVVSSESLSTGELMKQYSADPAVQYVEPDYVVHADAALTPNDPFFGGLWGMSQISAPLAWGTSTGSADVVVADIDTGVDYTHPDLAANMWHNPGEVAGNDIDDDGNGYVDDIYGIDAASGDSDPSDPHGHGTHTSGTIAAVGDNGIGVTGVAWTARIMALEFMGSSGSGYTSDAVTCINYMTWEKVHGGVNVVAANCSWGGGDSSQTLHDAIASAGDAGIVVVCAAGNGGADDVGDDNDSAPHYPSSFDCANIISVAATDSSDRLASFSNWGATSVDLAAPGVNILSTVPTLVDASGYQSWSGTSMATPHVTGAVALMAAAYPTESMATRISMIESSVDLVPDLSDKVKTGGRLDLANALYRGVPITITGFAPPSGPVGTSVTVTGTGFTHATAVRFNGTAAATFTVDSDSQVTATVPAGTATGPITVAVPGYAATSATSFIRTGGDWFWQNPLPQGNGLASIDFTDVSHGWAVGGGGTILATSDGGTTWMPQTSGSTSVLTSVDFVDRLHGWASGSGGTILATTDGGAHWAAQTSGVAGWVNALAFHDAWHGWAVGAGGTILATRDGGATWTPQASGARQWLQSVDFVDANHGWVVGERGTILATSDAGAHWVAQSSGTTNIISSVVFTDVTHGWAAGCDEASGTYEGTILLTTDGGATWTARTPGSHSPFSSVSFSDASHGLVAGDGGTILATSDGGVTWAPRDTKTSRNLDEVVFADATHAWAVGYAGTILTTADAGGTWTKQSTGSDFSLNSVDFIDCYHGWAAGYGGDVLATDDGGATWTAQASSITRELNGLVFPDADHGWAVGNGGSIIATTDGGAHWASQNSGIAGNVLCSVDFIDDQRGWVVGYSGDTRVTVDGGKTWTFRDSGTRDNLLSVDFVDATHGWAVGYGWAAGGNPGTIMATSDGGLTWTPQAANTNYPLRSVAFVDSRHGWAVGGVGSTAGGAGVVLATTDGGVHWQLQYSASQPFSSVDFADAQHGWAAGGGIYWTADGGAHWTPQASDVVIAVLSLDFVDAAHGWAAGGAGILGYADSIDETPPLTTCIANDAWQKDSSVVSLRAVDDFRGSGMTGGKAKTEYKLDDGDWTSGTVVTVPAPTDHTGDGEHTVQYRSTDAAGNTEGAKSVTVRIDTTPPSGTFALAGGAATTSSLTVSADSAVSDAHGPLEMRFSLDDGANWSAWETYAASRNLTLPDGLGKETTLAQYRDAAGNVRGLSDDIELVDATPPTTTASGADALWHNAQVTVTLTPSDNIGGAGMMGGPAKTEYKIDSGDWATGTEVDVPAKTDHSSDGEHTVSYRSTDAAGNTEEAKSVTVRIDTTPPSGTFALAGGAATTTTSVSGDSSVADANGPLQMRFSLDGKASWSVWGTYAASKALTLPGGLGTKTVYAQYRDAAGNVLEVLDTIELISQSPTPTPTPTPSRPALTRLSPTSGHRGITVTITGKDFGTRVSAGYVKFGTKKCAKYVSWSPTRIKCKVPAKAKFGKLKVVVVTAGGTSSAKTFTVKR